MVDVLLTGASGLLGTWLRRTAPAGAAVVPLVHRHAVGGTDVVADLRDPAATAVAVAQVRPELVIHAAYALDEGSIVHATRHVVEAAAAIGARVVFVSTDAVFAGDGVARAEGAVPDPIWDYGRWKAAAETAVAASVGSTTVRLPLVVSLEPADHVVARIRSEAAAGRSTTWFDDEVRQPAMADELAAAIWRIASLPSEQGAGVWQLPGPEHLTRFEIAQRVAAALDLPEDVVAAEPTPASLRRPRDLHLLDGRARAEIGWNPSPILR